MNERESEPASIGITMNQTINLIFIAAHIWYLPWELILRRRFGRRYVDLYLFAAALWPIFFAGLLFPGLPFAWCYWAFWLVIVLGIYHRVVAARLDRQGIIRHSQYNGFPILCRILRKDEYSCKTRYEVLVVAALSASFAFVSPSLMLFGFGSLIAGAVKCGISEMYHENEIADLHDAQIEQANLADRFNRRRS